MKLRESFDSRTIEIIDYAYRNSPATKSRFDKAGLQPSDIRSFKDLEKIPILRQDEVIALQRSAPPCGGLLSIPLSNLQRIFVSPGPIYRPQEKAKEEEEVAPLYYDRSRNDLPQAWLSMMKESIRSIVPVFNSRRMLREYCEQMYLPAAGV